MIVSIIIFFVVLSILVLVHEFGHFIVAKKAGILVEEFGFGLPPRVFSKKIGETIFSLNALPIGGFVKLHGESTMESLHLPDRAFLGKSKKARVAIVLAGVVMNFLLGVVAFAIVYSVSGIPQETKNVKVLEIGSSSPAQIAGFVVGDIVRQVDKTAITSTNQFINEIEKRKGQRVEVVLERNLQGKKDQIKVSLKPRADPPQGEGPLGVTISATEIYYPPLYARPFVGAYYGFKESLFWGKTVIFGFVKIFTDLAGGQAPKDLAGPVGIFAITSQAAKFGILSLVNFVGILSINLAVLNIIPFPALDGGRLLFIGLEAILGKKILPKVESTIHTIGMVILLMLIFAITAHDIQRLISAGGLSGFLEGITK